MRTYHQLTLEEREKIHVLQATGMSLRDIAKILNRSHTSLSWELRRNKTGQGKKSRELLTFQYIPSRAQKKHRCRYMPVIRTTPGRKGVLKIPLEEQGDSFQKEKVSII